MMDRRSQPMSLGNDIKEFAARKIKVKNTVRATVEEVAVS